MSMCAQGRRSSPKKSMWLCLSVLLLLQGNWGLITVTQSPSVVVSSLNHNVTLGCRFTHTPDLGVHEVILYWLHSGSQREDLYAYPESQALPQYKHRVVARDSSRTSEDKAVVLLNATWSDSHRYQCMVSYETPGDPERKRGAGVLLLLHDSMAFDLAPGTVSELLCSVEVSPDLGFHLSAFQDGVLLMSVQNRSQGVPHVTLSLRVPLNNGTECQLNHTSGFILSKIYTFQTQSYPEPVLLYVAILLVPFIILIILLTAYLIMKSRHAKS